MFTRHVKLRKNVLYADIKQYSVEMPEEQHDRIKRALPPVKMFSWKYTFLKDLLIESFANDLHFVLWDPMLPDAEYIMREFSHEKINWDKAVGYLACTVNCEKKGGKIFLEYRGEGILFLTNGIAIHAGNADTVFYSWMQVCALSFMPTDKDGKTGHLLIDDMQSFRWAVSVEKENKAAIHALPGVVDTICKNCLEGARQMVEDYLLALLNVHTEMFLELDMTDPETAQEAPIFALSFFRLALRYGQQKMIFPVLRDLNDRLLSPNHLINEMSMLHSFLNTLDMDASLLAEINEMFNQTAQRESEEKAQELLDESNAAWRLHQFDHAEQFAEMALKFLDREDTVQNYYCMLTARKRYKKLEQWQKEALKRGERNPQRVFWEQHRDEMDHMRRNYERTIHEVETIVLNEDLQQIKNNSWRQDDFGMTPLMYAVWYDVPSVYQYYIENFRWDHPGYALKNILGFRAVELAAFYQTGQAFCRTCARLAGRDLQEEEDAVERYLNLDSVNVGTVISYRLAPPSDFPNPFRAWKDELSLRMIQSLTNVCSSIQRNAERLFLVQTAFYLLHTEIGEESQEPSSIPFLSQDEQAGQFFPPIVLTKSFSERLMDVAKDYKNNHEQLLRQNPDYVKDEFETQEEYRARIGNSIRSSMENVYGTSEEIMRRVYREIQEEAEAARTGIAKIISDRQKLLAKMLGYEEFHGVWLGKYDAEMGAFIAKPDYGWISAMLVGVPKEKARGFAQRYRGVKAVEVDWSSQLVINLLGESLSPEEGWDQEEDLSDYSLWVGLAENSSGVLPTEWATKCASLYNRDEKERNALLLSGCAPDNMYTGNEFMYRRILYSMWLAEKLRSEKDLLMIFATGKIQESGVDCEVGACIFNGEEQYFFEDDQSWAEAEQ